MTGEFRNYEKYISKENICFDLGRIADLKLLISGPDPDPTWRVISDPDPAPGLVRSGFGFLSVKFS